MEEKLAASLSEREIAEFFHDDKVEPGDEAGKPPLFTVACFCLKPINEIDDIEEPALRSVADKGTGKRDGQMGLSCSGPTDQNNMVLLGEEGPSSMRPKLGKCF